MSSSATELFISSSATELFICSEIWVEDSGSGKNSSQIPNLGGQSPVRGVPLTAPDPHTAQIFRLPSLLYIFLVVQVLHKSCGTALDRSHPVHRPRVRLPVLALTSLLQVIAPPPPLQEKVPQYFFLPRIVEKKTKYILLFIMNKYDKKIVAKKDGIFTVRVLNSILCSLVFLIIFFFLDFLVQYTASSVTY
jgi:hypothetical protein